MDDAEFAKRLSDALDDVPLDDMAWTALGVEGYELGRAMLMVLARRYGKAFVDEVSDELRARQTSLEGSGHPQDTERGHLLSNAEALDALDEAEIIASAPGAAAR